MNNNDIVFRSYDNLHKINLTIENEDNCWFNIDSFNTNNCKTFLILIKEVIEFINNKNIKNIKQYIHTEDCNYFKNSIINKYDDKIFIVKTEIKYFVEELIRVLEIKLI
jgi:hypothetical protein